MSSSFANTDHERSDEERFGEPWCILASEVCLEGSLVESIESPSFVSVSKVPIVLSNTSMGSLQNIVVA